MSTPIEGPTAALQPADLARLERVLIELRVPVAFAAPAPDRELAAAQMALSRELPADLKTLYRWHDGVARLTPRGVLLAVAKAVDEHAQIQRDLGGVSESRLSAQFLPLLQMDGDYLMVQCGQADSSPIFHWSPWMGKPAPVYASVLHMVKVFEQAYLWRAFHPGYDGWHEDPALLRRVADSFQPGQAARRATEAVLKCAIARDARAPSMQRQIALRELCYEPTAAPALIELLDDPDPEIVRHAAFALGAMHVREAMPALLSLLGRAPQIAADALAGVLTPEDAPLVGRLSPLLSQPDRQVRIAGLQALSALRSPDAVPAVIELLHEGDPGLYFYAIKVLANTRDRRALEPLHSLHARRNSIGLQPVPRGGPRGSPPTPDHLAAMIETAVAWIQAAP